MQKFTQTFLIVPPPLKTFTGDLTPGVGISCISSGSGRSFGSNEMLKCYIQVL